MLAGVQLRPVTAADTAFLRELFASTREVELALLPGGAAVRDSFLDMQCRAQARAYRDAYPRADHHIVEVGGVAAGRLYVDRGPEWLHVVDVSLLPDYRGQGLGAALVQGLLAEATAAGCGLCLTVEKANPAVRLYQRLGLTVASEDGIYQQMTAGAAVRAVL